MTLVLCGCATHKTVTFECDSFDRSVLDIVIQHIHVKDATAEEAVMELERLWQKELGARHPPGTIFLRHAWPTRRYVDTSERVDTISKVSFEATNITVDACLQLISQVAPIEGFKIKRGKLIITYRLGLTEDWETVSMPISERGRHFLCLSDQITTDQLTARMKLYGLKFQQGFAADWSPRLGKIRITNYPAEINKLRGLLALIDEGNEIIRMPNEAMQADGAGAGRSDR